MGVGLSLSALHIKLSYMGPRRCVVMWRLATLLERRWKCRPTFPIPPLIYPQTFPNITHWGLPERPDRFSSLANGVGDRRSGANPRFRRCQKRRPPSLTPPTTWTSHSHRFRLQRELLTHPQILLRHNCWNPLETLNRFDGPTGKNGGKSFWR